MRHRYVGNKLGVSSINLQHANHVAFWGDDINQWGQSTRYVCWGAVEEIHVAIRAGCYIGTGSQMVAEAYLSNTYAGLLTGCVAASGAFPDDRLP